MKSDTEAAGQQVGLRTGDSGRGIKKKADGLARQRDYL